jgi:hypothetical protein
MRRSSAGTASSRFSSTSRNISPGDHRAISAEYLARLTEALTGDSRADRGRSVPARAGAAANSLFYSEKSPPGAVFLTVCRPRRQARSSNIEKSTEMC